MSDTPTPPALSPEEWKEWSEGEGLIRHLTYFGISDSPKGGVMLDGWFHGKDQHAAAALCLYQQPFGFSHEDVKRVEWILSMVSRVGVQLGIPFPPRGSRRLPKPRFSHRVSFAS